MANEIGPNIATFYVALSRAEREQYDISKTRAIEAERRYHEVFRTLFDWNQYIPRIWGIELRVDSIRLFDILRMRSVIPSYTTPYSDPQGFANIIEDLVRKQQDQCPVCMTKYPDQISYCGHAYCSSCIQEWVHNLNRQSCPLCRRGLVMNTIYSLSSKTSRLLDDLKPFNIQNEVVIPRRTRKVVILSQYHITLSTVNGALKGANFRTVYCDEWSNEISNFIESQHHVLLLKLNQLQGEISLPPNSIVYMMDACTPKVQQHVLRQVRCVGQENSIRVVRLVSLNTIEEKILAYEQKTEIIRRGGRFKGQVFELLQEIRALLKD